MTTPDIDHAVQNSILECLFRVDRITDTRTIAGLVGGDLDYVSSQLQSLQSTGWVSLHSIRDKRGDTHEVGWGLTLKGYEDHDKR